jgi:hypothetical protein
MKAECSLLIFFQRTWQAIALRLQRLIDIVNKLRRKPQVSFFDLLLNRGIEVAVRATAFLGVFYRN